MRLDVLTLFPEMFQGPMSESLLKKAQQAGLLSLNIVNIRDFASDKHKTVDDTSYGGGPGMVMKPAVVSDAIESTRLEITPDTSVESHRVIMMCPTGERLTHKKVEDLSGYEHLTVVCGHYEGIDARVSSLVDEEISIGDYVLTGGEIPAMVLIDAVARQIPGVVKEEESVKRDSFYNGLLDYPSYTKPEDYNGQKVPKVLLSGNHAEIDRWRRKESLRKTVNKIPALLAQAPLTEEDKKILGEIFVEE
jgi:tRNA (guanine37-N1)-methyltransferase